MPDPHAPTGPGNTGYGLAHHFRSYALQRETSTVGMWLFLVSEIMFFGGLFCAYTVYRFVHPEAFAIGSHQLDVVLGTTNTAILISSSLTMALAVRSAASGRRAPTIALLLSTVVLGLAFLGIKGYEYYQKWVEHFVPGPAFHFPGPQGHLVEMFFNFYFAMTGVHALHMIIGVGMLLALSFLTWRGRFSALNHNLVEGVGLYWHFVDIVWIFLFPLLYLVGRHLH